MPEDIIKPVRIAGGGMAASMALSDDKTWAVLVTDTQGALLDHGNVHIGDSHTVENAGLGVKTMMRQMAGVAFSRTEDDTVYACAGDHGDPNTGGFLVGRISAGGTSPTVYTRVGMTVPHSAFNSGCFANGKTQEVADEWCMGQVDRGVNGNHTPVMKWFMQRTGGAQSAWKVNTASELDMYRANNTYMIFCFFPTTDPGPAIGTDFSVSGPIVAEAIADKTNLTNALNQLKAKGFNADNCEIVLIQEPANTVTIVEWNNALRTYGHIVNNSGLPLCVNIQGRTGASSPNWVKAAIGHGNTYGSGPGSLGLPDVQYVASDIYCGSWLGGVRPTQEDSEGDSLESLCDEFNMSYSLNEVGANPSKQSPLPARHQSVANVTAYMNWVHDYTIGRMNIGKPLRQVCWWTANCNADGTGQLSSPIGLNPEWPSGDDPRIPLFQAWYDDFQTTVGTGDRHITWSVRSNTPQFEPNPPAAGDQLPDKARSTGRIIYCESTGTTKYIFVNTYKDGVMRSADNGTNWTTCNIGGSAPGSGTYFGRSVTQDPATSTTYWAGFYVGGTCAVYKCTTAHTSGTPNFTKVTNSPNVGEDFFISNGILYTVGLDGIYKLNISTGAWTNLNGTFVPTGSGHVWVTIAGYVDGSGNTILVIGDANPASGAGGATLIKIVIDSSGTVTSRANFVNVENHQYVPGPSGESRLWWHYGSSYQNWLGGAGFFSPFLVVDASNLNSVNWYCLGSEGFFRKLGSANWEMANNGMPMYLGRALALNPSDPLSFDWTTSDWYHKWCDDGIAYDKNTSGQDTPTGANAGMGFALSRDPVDSRLYLSCAAVGHKYENVAGDVFWQANNDRNGTWHALSCPSGGNAIIGLCGIRDASNNRVLLAASWGGGMYRWVEGTGWGGGPIDNTFCITGQVGYNIPFATGAGAQYVYCFDRKAGVYRSNNYGQTWVCVDNTLTSSSTEASHISAHPTNVGEIWVTTPGGLYKITNAHTGTVQGGTATKTHITAVSNVGIVAIAPASSPGSGTIFCTQQDTGHGGTVLMKDPSGVWVDVVPDGSFGRCNSRPEQMYIASDGAIVCSGSNIVVRGFGEGTPEDGVGGGESELFVNEQTSLNIGGSAGTIKLYFSQTGGHPSTQHNTLLAIMHFNGGSGETINKPAGTGWVLATDGDLTADVWSGSQSPGSDRTQVWIWVDNPGGLAGDSSNTQDFTYSLASGNAKGKLIELSTTPGANVFVDKVSPKVSAESSAYSYPIAGDTQNDYTGGMSLATVGVVQSPAPSGATWSAPEGWSLTGTANNTTLDWCICTILNTDIGPTVCTIVKNPGSGGTVTAWAGVLITLAATVPETGTTWIIGGSSASHSHGNGEINLITSRISGTARCYSIAFGRFQPVSYTYPVLPGTVEPITAELLDENLNSLGLIQYATMEANLYYNMVGSWQMTIPYDDAIWDLIKAGTSFIVHFNWGGLFEFGGKCESPGYEDSMPGSSGKGGPYIDLSGADYLSIIANRVAFPDPTLAWASQTGGSSDAFGPAPLESVIKHYVSRNVGVDALAARKVTLLDIASNQARGSNVSYNAKFADGVALNLMDVIRLLVAAGSPMGVSINKTSDKRLLFDVYVPRDLTSSVWFSRELGNLTSISMSYTDPTVTHALVRGASAFVETTNPDDQWSRIEQLVDQSSESDSTALTNAGKDALAQGAAGATMSLSTSDIPYLTFGRDYKLGDTVTVEVRPGDLFTDIISMVNLRADPTSSPSIVVTPTIGNVGNPDNSDQSVIAKLVNRVRNLEQRLNAQRG